MNNLMILILAYCIISYVFIGILSLKIKKTSSTRDALVALFLFILSPITNAIVIGTLVYQMFKATWRNKKKI